MNYLSIYSQESATNVWNSIFVDYGFLNMGSDVYHQQQKEYTFRQKVEHLIQNGQIQCLLKVCANMTKISKNVAEFIIKGIILNKDIVNCVQVSTLKGEDSAYFEICSNVLKYQDKAMTDCINSQIVLQFSQVFFELKEVQPGTLNFLNNLAKNDSETKEKLSDLLNLKVKEINPENEFQKNALSPSLDYMISNKLENTPNNLSFLNEFKEKISQNLTLDSGIKLLEFLSAHDEPLFKKICGVIFKNQPVLKEYFGVACQEQKNSAKESLYFKKTESMLPL